MYWHSKDSAVVIPSGNERFLVTTEDDSGKRNVIFCRHEGTHWIDVETKAIVDKYVKAWAYCPEPFNVEKNGREVKL